ncbi:DNA-methyltransferase [Amycolatopsis sp.]|uniref:DNA-methyltransferase n=1 Tax=Amycolatopsis sp. TaxID=37632 RepID=UPI0039C89F6A
MIERTQPAPDAVASPAPGGAFAARRARRVLARIPTVASRRHRGRRPVSDTQERLAVAQASGGRLGSTSRQLSGRERSGTGGNIASRAASVVSRRVRAAVLAEYHAENTRRARDAMAELVRAGYTGRQVRGRRVAGRAVATRGVDALSARRAPAAGGRRDLRPLAAPRPPPRHHRVGEGRVMRPPYFTDSQVSLYTGDAVEVLSELADSSVHCVVTSPPYWGLRDYGTGTWIGGRADCAHSTGRGTNQFQSHTQSRDPGAAYPASPAHRGGNPRTCLRCGAVRQDRQYGLEPTPEAYVDTMRAVFAHLRRVLVDTGTVWLNLGDSYSADPPGRTRDPMRTSTLSGRAAAAPLRESVRHAGVQRTRSIPRKNLVGMPWRVAFALQHDGWILRNALVWHKPNAMPESVRDRLSNRYELLFLLAKQPTYWFDLDPVREPLSRPEALTEGVVIGGRKGRHGGIDATARRRGHTVYGTSGKYRDTAAFTGHPPGQAMRPTGHHHTAAHPRGKNPGDVWSITTRPLRAAHFAAFPIEIPLRCIAAGCPPHGVVLDPFSGAATTGLAARRLGRGYIGIDLNPDFHDIGLNRLGLAHGDHATPTPDDWRAAA